jgi:hypothetical protein
MACGLLFWHVKTNGWPPGRAPAPPRPMALKGCAFATIVNFLRIFLAQRLRPSSASPSGVEASVRSQTKLNPHECLAVQRYARSAAVTESHIRISGQTHPMLYHRSRKSRERWRHSCRSYCHLRSASCTNP